MSKKFYGGHFRFRVTRLRTSNTHETATKVGKTMKTIKVRGLVLKEYEAGEEAADEIGEDETADEDDDVDDDGDEDDEDELDE